MEEVWKDIPRVAGKYQVSNQGRLKRLRYESTMSNQTTSWSQVFEEKILSGVVDSHGYRQGSLVGLDNKHWQPLVHRLVADAFLPQPSEELVSECLKGGHRVVLINHKDGDRLNNRVDNLEWCTPSYNNEYSPQDYSFRSGSKAVQAILTEDDVDIIMSLRGKQSQQSIADMFGVKQITISNIYTGRSWSMYTGIPRKERNKGKDVAKTTPKSES